MEDAEEKPEGFHNRNSRRARQHLSVSVDNEHSDSDASAESQNLKIDAAASESTTRSVRTFSGLGEDPRLRRVPRTRPGNHNVSQPKNEILSRTLPGRPLRVSLYLLTLAFVVAAHLGADAAPPPASLSNLSKVTHERTLNRGRGPGPGPGALGPRPRDRWKSVNKNCKEYDVTSRAFLADLIFEGTARSRSRRASGRYVTFVIQKILKQKGASPLRPKTQIRLHFGGKAGRRPARVNPLIDCPLTSITSSSRAMASVRVGENYYVFADHFGPMNYTAKGEPIVVNRRNLKSIRSVLSRNKEKPPRILGLQDLNLKTTQQLRLNCQVRGRPVPRINWYKDDAPLIPSSRVNVTYYRRNSTIEIKSAELRDGGVYECRATSVTGKTAKKSAHVNVWRFYTPSTSDPEKSSQMKKCSVDAYCLNGGQCYFIEHLGEHMCECVPGFKGARCEVKEVSAIDARQPIEWRQLENPSAGGEK